MSESSSSFSGSRSSFSDSVRTFNDSGSSLVTVEAALVVEYNSPYVFATTVYMYLQNGIYKWKAEDLTRWQQIEPETWRALLSGK